MSLRFLVDHMLPGAVVELFRTNGHEANSTRRLGQIASTDEAIWTLAERTDAIVVTKDSDFLYFVGRSQKARVLHIRGGNMGTKELLEALAKALPQIELAFAAGETIVELR